MALRARRWERKAVLLVDCLDEAAEAAEELLGTDEC